MLTQPKCILFDVDGVIIKSERFSIQYSKKYNILEEDMIPFFKWKYRDCLIGKADLKEEIKPFLKKWNWKKSADDFIKNWFETDDDVDKRVISVIKQLKNKWIICNIVSEQEKYRTDYMKKNMWFEKIFNHIFSPYYVCYTKLEKEFYIYIVEKMKKIYNINIDEIIFFDDSEKNINIAKKLWINSYIYKWFDDFENILLHIHPRCD